MTRIVLVASAIAYVAMRRLPVWNRRGDAGYETEDERLLEKNIQGPVHTTPEKSLYFFMVRQTGLPSILTRHENGPKWNFSKNMTLP